MMTVESRISCVRRQHRKLIRRKSAASAGRRSSMRRTTRRCAGTSFDGLSDRPWRRRPRGQPRWTWCPADHYHEDCCWRCCFVACRRRRLHAPSPSAELCSVAATTTDIASTPPTWPCFVPLRRSENNCTQLFITVHGTVIYYYYYYHLLRHKAATTYSTTYTQTKW